MRRPNILVIYTDQQRWDALGANGNPVIKTPNLDRLAAEGTNFTHCFCQNPVCMPSRVSFMTGQYCSALNITHMGVTVPEQTQTIQRILSRYGYDNGLIGKLHFLPHANRDHRELHPAYDFDHMELSDEPGCYEDAYRAWVRMKAPEELDNLSLGLPPANHHWRDALMIRDDISHPDHFPKGGLLKKTIPHRTRSDLTQAAFVSEQTSQFIKDHKDRPFFCFAGFYSPHSPWVAPQEYIDLYSLEDMPIPQYPRGYVYPGADSPCDEAELRDVTRGYYAMVSEVDHHVGKILEALDQSNLSDNTIVVFTSDHGEWLGEHMRYGKGYWAPDAVSRVPLIIKAPRALRGAACRQVHGIVECVDAVPTLLALAGIQIPPEVQGSTLPVTDRDDQYRLDGIGLTEHRGWKSMRFEGFRYVAEENGHEMLFDLEKDPGEYDDVSDKPEYADVLSRARHLLIRRMLRIERVMKKEWAY